MSERSLPKRVGLGGAALLSFNGAVGAAVFALPATLNSDVGTWAAVRSYVQYVLPRTPRDVTTPSVIAARS